MVYSQNQPARTPVSEKVITKTVTFQTTEIDNSMDEMAQFDLFVKKNIRALPGAYGPVMVSFTTEKNGSITNIKVEKSLSKAADQEALRIVRLYPKWNPNTIDGQPVSARMEVPITFIKK